MRFLILVSILAISQVATANWLKDFCSKHLIADDPSPYAEFETDELIRIFEVYRSGQQLDELLYRYRHQMLNARQIVKFRSLFK